MTSAIIAASVFALGAVVLTVRWLSHGIYINWHTAYICKDCGHIEHERPRFYWRVCPKCGSTESETVEVIGKQTIWGWKAK